MKLILFQLFVSIISSISLAPDVSTWLDSQLSFSTSRVFANIHPAGTVPGTVVAGTSKTNPPYFFHWTRDGALTMQEVVAYYLNSSSASGDQAFYENTLWDYASVSRVHQNAPSCQPRTDSCQALGGPGEPKYNIDGSVYVGSWGRLQNDGPALRASTLIRFAKAYLAKGGSLDKVKSVLYDGQFPSSSVVKVDLEYVANHWGSVGFDLWYDYTILWDREEKNGNHFYTRQVQRRALIEGADFAQQLNDVGAATYYRQQAALISSVIENHWDANNGYIREQLDTDNTRSQKNIGTILAVIHAKNFNDNFYGPSNDRVLSTALKIQQDFNTIYGLNKQNKDASGLPLGPAVGRYPEDVYDGTQGSSPSSLGNPWFLATLSISELYYQAAIALNTARVVSITSLSAPFYVFIGVDANIAVAGATYAANTSAFNAIVNALVSSAELTFRRVKYHVGPINSPMSEQYDRNTGMQKSAENLTWSYVSLISAAYYRQLAASQL